MLAVRTGLRAGATLGRPRRWVRELNWTSARGWGRWTSCGPDMPARAKGPRTRTDPLVMGQRAKPLVPSPTQLRLDGAAGPDLPGRGIGRDHGAAVPLPRHLSAPVER